MTPSGGRWRQAGRLPAPWIFPVAVVAAVVVLGLLRLHGSSLGLYATGLGAGEREAGVLAGPPRAVRSDEWNVRTPWVLRQAELNMPSRVASGVGSHDVAVVGDLPVRGWESILRPHTWSYLLLDPTRAFAIEWWAYHAVQLLGVYALLVVLTRRHLVAALAAIVLTLSPATQWWAAPGTFTTVGYGSLCAALMLLAIRAVDGRARVALSVAAGLAGAAFLAALYVPWIIGTALVVGPVTVGAVLAPLLDPDTRRRTGRALAVVVPVTAAVAGVLFGSFLLVHRDAVTAISDTVYPGQQSFEGGSARMTVMWGAAFDYFSSRERNAVVVNDTNQSENASALLLLFPTALAGAALAAKGRLRSPPSTYPLIGCLVGGAVIVTWMVLPVPGSVGRFALLTQVSPGRLFLPLGLAGVVALALFVHHQLASSARLPLAVVLAIVAVFAAAQWWAATSYSVDGSGVDLRLASVFVAVVSIGVALGLGGRPVPGLAVLACFCLWQASFINPLQRGTSPLTDSLLRHSFDRLARAEGRDAAWIVFGGDAMLLGTLTAAGINTLAAISPYPDDDAWRVLDPGGTTEDVWNRYTRVSFVPVPVGSPPRFRLVQADSIEVGVDPCSSALTTLGVTMFVSPNFEITDCATPVARLPFGEGYVQVSRRVP